MTPCALVRTCHTSTQLYKYKYKYRHRQFNEIFVFKNPLFIEKNFAAFQCNWVHSTFLISTTPKSYSFLSKNFQIKHERTTYQTNYSDHPVGSLLLIDCDGRLLNVFCHFNVCCKFNVFCQ